MLTPKQIHIEIENKKIANNAKTTQVASTKPVLKNKDVLGRLKDLETRVDILEKAIKPN